MKKIFLLILIFIQVNLYSQTGVSIIHCEITLRNPNKEIRLFQVPYNRIQKKELKSTNNKYYAEGIAGMLGTGFYSPVILTKKKDTMRIFLPVHRYVDNNMYLNVPFRKGDYRIPYHTYVVHKILKPEYRKKLKPNLNGDWSDFEIHKKPYKNIYFKRSNLIYRKCNNKYDYKKIDKKLKRISQSNNENYLLKDINWYEHFVGFNNKDFIGYNNNIKINFIGVLKTMDIAIYQEKQNGPIEYGVLKTSKDNLIKLHMSHSSFINSKQNKPTMYGLYTTKIKYDGGKSHCELFEIVIEPNTIKKITEKL